VKKIELNEYFIIVDYPEKVRKFIRKCLRSKDIFYFERELLKKPALVFWRFHNNQQ
jgi:hypothetical protein